MGFVELVVIAIGLGMDAFSVSICKGLAMNKMSFKNANIIAIYFGVFQAIMPFIGYMIGYRFQESIIFIDHWMAFILLSIIGIQMVLESMKKCEEDTNPNLDFKTMIVLAIATSIDALVVGVTFAFLEVNIFSSILIIGAITYILSIVGVKIGNIFGIKYKAKAEVIGGVILILMGVKILLEHLEVISF